jgi:hypothetical protein
MTEMRSVTRRAAINLLRVNQTYKMLETLCQSGIETYASRAVPSLYLTIFVLEVAKKLCHIPISNHTDVLHLHIPFDRIGFAEADARSQAQVRVLVRVLRWRDLDWLFVHAVFDFAPEITGAGVDMRIAYHSVLARVAAVFQSALLPVCCDGTAQVS